MPSDRVIQYRALPTGKERLTTEIATVGDMGTLGRSQELADLEIELLLEGLYRYYGYDFREYAQASLRRRIWNFARSEKLKTISSVQERVLHDPQALERFLSALSVNVTAMFRDPDFFRLFRQKVVPMLRTYPSINIWHAGCATGEEVYSMAILLKEENLLERTTLYATDLHEGVLKTARAGIFPLDKMKDYTANYMQAGGKRSFSEYYTAAYDNAIFRPTLSKNMLFAQHNLVTDSPFNQFHIIWCRNVMIYFSRTLQEKVQKLLCDSLITFGTLGLGNQETLKSTPYEKVFEPIEDILPLYRKIVRS